MGLELQDKASGPSALSYNADTELRLVELYSCPRRVSAFFPLRSYPRTYGARVITSGPFELL